MVKQADLRFILILGFLLVGYPFPVAAQTNEPVRVEIGGQQYWIHTVKKGETLYAISKQYAVSQTVIATHNPDIYYGLKKGQKLKIPILGNESSNTKDTAAGYVLHVVSQGDNLFQLSRQYGISVGSIRRVNSLKSDTLRLWETIRIPTSELPEESAHTEQYITYKVQQGEGLYGIARRHKVTQDDIVRANPFLENRGLSVGDELRIPLPFSSTASGTALRVLDGEYQVFRPQCDTLRAFPKWKTLRISLILPFSIDKPIAPITEDEGDFSSSSSQRIADARFVEFYQGFLLAIERFKLAGRSIEILVFDSRRDPVVVEQLVNSDTLQNSHLIIGPVYPKNVSIVGQYAALNRITLVSPLSGKTPSYDTNPFLFQANPSFLTQIRGMVSSLISGQPQQIIVLKEESITDSETADNIELMLQNEVAQLPQPDAVRVSSLLYAKGKAAQTYTSQVKALITPERENIVIIPSSNEPFISDVLGQVNRIAIEKKLPIQLVGLPKWLRMENLDFTQLINLNATVCSPFYVDYSKPTVGEFVDNYRATFRAEPTQYAFQGYDIATYFITATLTYGEDFRYCLDRINPDLLQNRFDFRQSQSFSSYESNGIFMLRYNTQDGVAPATKTN